MKSELKRAKDRTWKTVSEYIRKRDKGKCYTCGKVGDYKEMNAGHYVHKNCLDYNEENLHCQCVHCNQYLSGNLAIYTVKLIKEFGIDKPEELMALGNQVRKFTIEELEQIRSIYKEKIDKLSEIK
jgi:hypothetical protein